MQSGSPAAQAGLQAHTDYIVAADRVLEDRDDLCVLRAWAGGLLAFVVQPIPLMLSARVSSVVPALTS